MQRKYQDQDETWKFFTLQEHKRKEVHQDRGKAAQCNRSPRPESVSKATEQEQQRSGSFPYGWLISLMRLAKTTFKSGEQKPERGRRRALVSIPPRSPSFTGLFRERNCPVSDFQMHDLCYHPSTPQKSSNFLLMIHLVMVIFFLQQILYVTIRGLVLRGLQLSPFPDTTVISSTATLQSLQLPVSPQCTRQHPGRRRRATLQSLQASRYSAVHALAPRQKAES